MPFYAPPAYRNASKVQNLLLDKMQDIEETGIALAQLARAWIETEHLKREMRGLPRLSAHSMKELAEAKRSNMKRIAPASSFEEITEPEGKESLSSPTVPAMPPGEAPSASSVDNDK